MQAGSHVPYTNQLFPNSCISNGAKEKRAAVFNAQKEEEAAKVKEEVRVIWGDYFKAPQFEQFPNANELVHNIMLTASACKQGIEREKGEKLLTLVNEFAAAFWATKNVGVRFLGKDLNQSCLMRNYFLFFVNLAIPKRRGIN